MTRPDQQHDGLRRSRAIFDAWMRRRVVRKSNVRTAFSDFLEHIVDRQDADSDIQLRISRTERREHLVDQCIDLALADGQLDMAFLQSSQRPKPGFELLPARPASAPELQQASRRLGRPDASRLT